MEKKIFDRKYWADLRAKSLKAKPLKRTALKRTQMKKKYYPKKNKIELLYEFYQEMMDLCTWVCVECEQNVYSNDEKFRLACIAHILPKDIFRSIAKNRLNIMCLGGTCGHHNKYDLSWESAQKMKIWPQVQEIIVTVLIPLLPEKEFKKLPDFLKDEYNRQSSKEGT